MPELTAYKNEVKSALEAFGSTDSLGVAAAVRFDVDAALRTAHKDEVPANRAAIELSKEVARRMGGGKRPYPHLERGPEGWRLGENVLSPRLKFDHAGIYIDGERIESLQSLESIPTPHISKLLAMCGVPIWGLAERFGWPQPAPAP